MNDDNKLRWLSHLALAGAVGIAALAATSHINAAEDYSGRWVMAQLTTTVAEVPVVGKIYATSRLVTLHDLVHEGERLSGAGQICRLELDSGSRLVKTILPAAFIRSLPRPMIDATVKIDDGLIKFSQKKQTIVVGAELKRPHKDKLPTSPKDSRVRDQDGDDKPGVTIKIDGIVSGDIYVAQRTWTRLKGTKRVDESFQGNVSFGNEQSILEATSSLLEDAPEAKPLPDKSWFRLMRVSKDATCKDARRATNDWLD